MLINAESKLTSSKIIINPCTTNINRWSNSIDNILYWASNKTYNHLYNTKCTCNLSSFVMINCMYILYYRDDYMSYLKPNTEYCQENCYTY